MLQKDIPQDESKLVNFTKEVCYAIDEQGQYTTGLSTGWEIKTDALQVAWSDIQHRLKDAKRLVLAGKCSPITYYMELKLMDLSILSSYTGFWEWQIKRHMKADVFNKLSEKKLQKYADVFEVSISQLKTMNSIEK